MDSAALETLARNLEDVRRRIAAASERAGRSAREILFVAVTKSATVEWMRGLYELGCRDFGESRPQQLVQRAAQLPADVRWHLIGHLQRNKAALVWPVASWLHSVDSQRLIDCLTKIARTSMHRPAVLLEVNVSGEAAKDGFAPERLRFAWPELPHTSSLDIQGLMTMAPLSDDPESARTVFRALRMFRDELRGVAGDSAALPQLSMGMSGDFEVAIEEGATIVRVGSRLFEGLEA